MPPFERHLFVCVNRRPDGHARGCCASKGAETLKDALKLSVKKSGLKGRVRVNAAACLDACEHGVAAVVYPEGVWYAGLTLADVDEVVREHLVHGRPVERLRMALDPVPDDPSDRS